MLPLHHIIDSTAVLWRARASRLRDAADVSGKHAGGAQRARVIQRGDA
jgi:hypothetical protein